MALCRAPRPSLSEPRTRHGRPRIREGPDLARSADLADLSRGDVEDEAADGVLAQARFRDPRAAHRLAAACAGLACVVPKSSGPGRWRRRGARSRLFGTFNAADNLAWRVFVAETQEDTSARSPPLDRRRKAATIAATRRERDGFTASWRRPSRTERVPGWPRQPTAGQRAEAWSFRSL
jgi:hypothetical protein